MPQASSLSPRFLFILLGALAGLTPLAVDMYLPAIPAIARDLATSIDGAQLTISAFLGGFAIGQLFYGPLADSFGRKPVILAGLTMFAVASVGCAMADSSMILSSVLNDGDLERIIKRVSEEPNFRVVCDDAEILILDH